MTFQNVSLDFPSGTTIIPKADTPDGDYASLNGWNVGIARSCQVVLNFGAELTTMAAGVKYDSDSLQTLNGFVTDSKAGIPPDNDTLLQLGALGVIPSKQLTAYVPRLRWHIDISTIKPVPNDYPSTASMDMGLYQRPDGSIFYFYFDAGGELQLPVEGPIGNGYTTDDIAKLAPSWLPTAESKVSQFTDVQQTHLVMMQTKTAGLEAFYQFGLGINDRKSRTAEKLIANI